MTHENVIEMREITKIFGQFVANDKINLHLRRGEIHALLGENGAGKSTLMNMLAGLLEPTSGEIAVNGQVVKLDSPSKAASLGIGMVHQHFMLVEAFTVAENIILGSEITKNGVLDIKKAIQEIKELSEKYGLAVDPSAKIEDISVGAQQRVEILKTLYRGADILIFDEPTAVLTPAEIDELMIIMKNLVKEGKSIILITHKLDEIRAVSDRVTVIRRGKSIETVEIAGATNQDLAEMMVGRSVSFTTEKNPPQPKEVILSIKDLVVNENRGIPAVKNLSLDVRAGEIVGIILITIFAIFAVWSNSSSTFSASNSKDPEVSFDAKMDEYKLEERPITIRDAELMFGSEDGPKDETPEKKEARLQSVVDTYNNQLKKEQDRIKREKEEEKKRDDDFATTVLIGSAVGVSLLLISIFIKSKQPPAMTISEGKLDIKSSIFQDMNELDLDKVKKIEYKIKTYSSDDMQKTNRMLYFYDKNGSTLDSIDLNNLSGADFNDIYKEISRQAPHIEWIFPE